MRGTETAEELKGGTVGIIPAHAGNRPPSIPVRNWLSDHPRTCGEQDGNATGTHNGSGSSPHMRGTDLRTGRKWGFWLDCASFIFRWLRFRGRWSGPPSSSMAASVPAKFHLPALASGGRSRTCGTHSPARSSPAKSLPHWSSRLLIAQLSPTATPAFVRLTAPQITPHAPLNSTAITSPAASAEIAQVSKSSWPLLVKT